MDGADMRRFGVIFRSIHVSLYGSVSSLLALFLTLHESSQKNFIYIYQSFNYLT